MNKIRTLLFAILSVVVAAPAATAAESHVLKFTIDDGGSRLSATATQAIERNLVNLLTMMSDAQAKGSKTLNFSGIAITPEAIEGINLLWKHQPMRVRPQKQGEFPYIHENLLIMQGIGSYQIRNIPVSLHPNETPGKSKNSEISVNFSSTGTITDLNISMERQQYKSLMDSVESVQDYDNRLMLAHWMDQLKTAYETKNLDYLMSLIDKNATIITGVRSSKPSSKEIEFRSKETFDYYVYNKTQYGTKMRRVFQNNKEIDVNFLDQEYAYNAMVSVVGPDGEERPRYYMVWCTQEWMATNYSDVGRLFVLWDFKNPEEPLIMIRAWTHPDDPKQFSDEDFILPVD